MAVRTSGHCSHTCGAKAWPQALGAGASHHSSCQLDITAPALVSPPQHAFAVTVGEGAGQGSSCCFCPTITQSPSQHILGHQPSAPGTPRFSCLNGLASRPAETQTDTLPSADHSPLIRPLSSFAMFLMSLVRQCPFSFLLSSPVLT